MPCVHDHWGTQQQAAVNNKVSTANQPLELHTEMKALQACASPLSSEEHMADWLM